jgi:transcriptional regulator with XRE-family HTH domain
VFECTVRFDNLQCRRKCGIGTSATDNSSVSFRFQYERISRKVDESRAQAFPARQLTVGARVGTPRATLSSAPSAGTVDPVALGGTIRSTRKLKGLKLRQIADQVGCSESLLSKIENGHVSPSLAMLGKIAQTLQLAVADLFFPIDLRQAVSRSGKRQAVTLHGAGSSVERLVPVDGAHLLEGNLHILAPGAGSRGTLSHEGEEVGYVVVGQFELTLGHEVITLEAGDSFNFRSVIEHAYRNPGKEATRVVWVSTPSRGGSAGAVQGKASGRKLPAEAPRGSQKH